MQVQSFIFHLTYVFASLPQKGQNAEIKDLS